MNKLIVNTANDELFIVLKKGNEIFSELIGSKMHHNETMLPKIDEILAKNNVDIHEIKEYGVIIGPGSFTGIRVGISTIKAFRDAVGGVAKGVNNLDYLYALATSQNKNIETIAINGSRDSYFVAKLVNGIVYKYERNLTLNELIKVAENKPVGMFKNDDNINCFVVKQDERVLLDCVEKSSDETLVPVYYQLSQAENEKIKRNEIVIKRAILKDLKDIVSIEQNNIKINTMTENQIKQAMKNKNYCIYKAELENKIVGFVMLQKSDELNIDSIAVNKEYRNFGIATKLIKKAEVVAKRNKISVLSLEVSNKNITAYLLYKKLAFVERRVRKNYYADGSNAIEMFKTL